MPFFLRWLTLRVLLPAGFLVAALWLGGFWFLRESQGASLRLAMEEVTGKAFLALSRGGSAAAVARQARIWPDAVRIFDASGRILADPDLPESLLSSLPADPTAPRSSRGGEEEIRFFVEEGHAILDARRGERWIRIEKEFAYDFPTGWTSFCVGLYALAGLFWAWTQIPLLRSLRHLEKSAEALAKGEDPGPAFSEDPTGLARPLEQAGGRLARLLGDLESERERLGNILASTQEGVLLMDDRGGVLFENASFRALTGCAPGFPGQPYWARISLAPLVNRLRKVLEDGTGEPPSEVVEAGERTLRVRSIRLRGGKEILVTLLDLTEGVRMETERREMVSNASHEINTPLTAIQGWLERLFDKEEQPAKRKILETLLRNSRRLRNLVRDLLQLSRLDRSAEEKAWEDGDARSAVRGAIETMEPAASAKGISLRLVADEAVPCVWNFDEIEQAVINLVDNAVKYSDQGEIVVTLARRGEGEALIQVADQGLGIPPGLEERIFERFFVVHPGRSREAGGTGLGLSIVKRIAERHGGVVEMQSRPGHGSTFRLVLPLRAPDPG